MFKSFVSVIWMKLFGLYGNEGFMESHIVSYSHTVSCIV